MFDFFSEGNKYYEYPSFEVAIYSLLLSLALSAVMAYTYRLTYDGRHFSKNLFQAMILSSLVTSMIMMAVGNNLAVGFGIIGAVAIIRFRTNIQNPRNIIFMFGALSIGITTGVQGYAVSVAGTVVFCMTAFLLRFSNFKIEADDKFEIECGIRDSLLLEMVKSKLAEISSHFEITDVRQRGEERPDKYSFTVQLKKNVSMQSAFFALSELEIQDLRIIRKGIVEQL